MAHRFGQNDVMNEAVRLKSEALALISAPEVTAEDLDKAEKMIADAEALATKSQKLAELKSRVGEIKVQDPPEGQDRNSNLWGGDFGKFLIAVKQASRQAPDPRLQYFESEVPDRDRKDLSESVGTAGGFLVPTEFLPRLMQTVAEKSIVRSRAMVIPMTRRSIEVPALKQDGTTPGVPHWFGGMLAYWESEAATMTETEPAFRYITLVAHELNAVTHTSNNLLADSAVSLSALLTGANGFPGVIAWKEDYAFLRGTGVGEPLGVTNASATISVSRNTPSTVKYDDLVNMMARQLPSANSIWVAHVGLQATLMLMNGPTGNPSYLWGSASAGIPNTLLGRPIIFTEKLPPVGTSGDIMLVDFSHYYIGDRQSTTIDSTDQVRWLKNQTSWKVTHRVDGQPWMDSPFTLADGTYTISPFVKLT